MEAVDPTADVERTGSIKPEVCDAHARRQQGPASTSGVRAKLKSFEHTLLKYNLEMRGIQRVEEDEKVQIGWFAYLQVFVLWVSVNLAANNIALGMLGPAVYGLGFRDASLCACFGALVGGIPVAWIATWGPLSGNRTMVGARPIVFERWCIADVPTRSLGATRWDGGRPN
jgi:hypothetical protein